MNAFFFPQESQPFQNGLISKCQSPGISITTSVGVVSSLYLGTLGNQLIGNLEGTPEEIQIGGRLQQLKSRCCKWLSQALLTLADDNAALLSGWEQAGLF